MSFDPDQFQTFADVIHHFGTRSPDAEAIRHIVKDGAPPRVTHYGRLYRQARAVAATLQDKPGGIAGERCLIMLPSGEEFAVAFFACFLAGAIAVPAFPPERNRQAFLQRLGGMIRDARPMAVLGLGKDLERWRSELTAELPVGGRLVAVDDTPVEAGDLYQTYHQSRDDLAFLQYTSGSTSAPKGVMVSHGNLMANEQVMAVGFGARDDEVWVNWLPLFHDMGLMSGLLLPIIHGHCVHLMTPLHFLARPVRWLELMSEVGGTFSGGPDFAYRLCAERIRDEDIPSLDLSRWRLAFTGSEPIRPETLAMFSERFRASGFRSESWAPSYGLAEATLFVTSHGFEDKLREFRFDAESLPDGPARSAAKTSTLIGCGPTHDPHHHVRLMDPEHLTEVAEGDVGEIWVSGPSVTLGYWQNEQATAKTFVEHDGQRWVRTGDLGVMRGEDLFIVGRQKDVIILNGQNLYPQDIEAALEQELELLRQGRIAAFATEDANGGEGIGLALEVSRNVRKMIKPRMLCDTISETLTDTLQVAPQLILLLDPGTLPRTTSGKLQRSACRLGWERGDLSVFAAWRQGRLLDDDEALADGSDTALMPEVVSAWREVLGQDQLDGGSHFFALGGDSVALMQVLSRLQSELALELDPGALFERPRLADFSAWVAAQREEGHQRPAIPARADNGPAPQSHAQQRLWFLDRLEGGSTAYHLAGEWQLTGQLDQQALQHSLDDLAARHDNLRTVFAEDDQQQGIQHVLEPRPVPVMVHDLSGEPDPDAALDSLNRTLVHQPMSLERGPLWRAHLVRLGEQDHRLLLVIHHIIADGWSVQVLVKEFAGLYKARVEGQASDLPDLPIRYTDYAHWQRSLLASGEGERQLNWWKAQLGEEQPVLTLPADRPRPDAQSHRGARVAFQFPADLSERLRALAREQGVTLFMLMLALYKTQLYRYSGQRDLRVAVPVAGRGRPETEGLVGLFVNTLVMRSQPSATLGFTDFLEAVKQTTQGAQAHADLPFDQLVEALQPERNLRHNPLCQVKFTQQFPLPDQIELPGLTLAMRQREDDTAHFDLGLDITDQAEGIDGVLTYALDLFDRARIEAFAQELVNLAGQVVDQPRRSLGELSLLAPTSALVGPLREYPARDLIALWNGHIDTSMGRQAIQYEDQAFDYAWLEAESNRLARWLQKQGVTADVTVGLCLDRSPEFAIAVLAVLKAGGAFVPLDPKWPAERQAFVLSDSHARCLLAHQPFDGFAGDTIGFGEEAGWRRETTAPLSVELDPGQAAYLIYTSGTSGTPKGVVVSHGAIANYVQAMLEAIAPSAEASMAMVSTVAADLGHTALFGALCSGRTLHLLSAERVMDAEAFASYMAEHRVAMVKIVPTHLAGLLQAENPARVLPAEALVLGGEALPAKLARQVRDLSPGCRLFNHYGPSESTVGVLTTPVADEQGDTVPLGTPLANIRATVLSGEQLPLPQGATGELYLGGAGLARGYLNRPEQTAEAFIYDPASPGERLYATGDCVQLLADGRFAFLGRNDDQVKIRGYRVSLGEIVQRIRAFDGVRDAHVQVDDSGHLVAWPLADALDVDGLRASLAAQLPDYMVPTHILPVDAFPLTANGKLDRQALPLPEQPGGDFAAPLDGVEALLAELWQSLLPVEKVGRHDNFFSLGGDSIISLQVIARARKQGVKLTPKQLFEKQTIAELAQVAEVSDVAAPAPASPQTKAPAAFPLTPIQRRFFRQPIERRQHWNQALRLRVSTPLQEVPLRQALTALVAAHPALRLRFGVEGARQSYRENESAEPLWTTRVEREDERLATFDEAQRSLDLDEGPLLRAVLATGPDQTQELLLVIHHLAVDGVSWRILLEDLQTAYQQVASGQAIELSQPAAGFHHWSDYLTGLVGGDLLAAEVDYWSAFDPQDAALSCDNPEGSAQVADGNTLTLTVNAEQTRHLINDAPRAYRTRINDLLLAALAEALGQWTGRNPTVITMEGHGRNGPGEAPDVSRTVGWFTTLYPVALVAVGDPLATLRHTKETLRRVPHEGLGYGVLQEMQGVDLPELTGAGLTFNYLGRVDAGENGGFVLSDGGTGASRDPSGPMANALVVDGQVREGQLRLDWTFSRERFSAAQVEELVALYRQALTTLIDRCQEADGRLTPSDVPLATLDQDELDTLADPANIEDIMPLAPMQEGILLHSLLEQGSGIYLMQDQYAVGSELDPEAFTQAWNRVVEDYPALRTGFHGLESGQPHQVVYRCVPSPVSYLDLSHLDRPDAEAELADQLALERQQGFDLSAAPLLKVRLVRFGAADYRIVQSHHHALVDAWCRGLMLQRFFAYYRAAIADQPLVLSTPRPYRDFVAWLGQQDATTALSFWRERLAGISERTPLPYDQRGKSSRAMTQVDAVELAIPEAEYQACADAARSAGVTLGTLIQAAWALLLRRHSGHEDVVFGLTVSGRPADLAGIEETVGLFINSLPFRVRSGDGLSGRDFLQQLQEEGAALRQYEHIALADIQAAVGVSGGSLFDSLLVFENAPVDGAVFEAAERYRIRPVAHRTHTNYPLTLVVQPGTTLRFALSYQSERFRSGDMTALLGELRRLLATLSESPERPVADLPIIGEPDRARLCDWNATRVDHGQPEPVHRLFERQAADHPDREALVFGDQRLSYGELDATANRLAHYLIGQGVGVGSLVGVATERSIEMVVALYAIQKAGAAYVPIDPDHPEARQQQVLFDADVDVLLTHNSVENRLPELGDLPVINLDTVDLSGKSDVVPEVDIHPQQRAYVIYTSGSTGKPKGVANTHAALFNRLQWMQSAYELGEGDTVLQKTPYSFDVSVWEFFWPLMTGARLVVSQPGDHRDPAKLVELIQRESITTIHFVPSMLSAFMAQENLSGCESLKRIVCSGEALPKDLQDQALARLPNTRLYNLYGPTEAAIDVTHWTCGDDERTTVPIGQPIDNLQIHILDSRLNEQPIGVPGELYIGGIGLAREYHGRPDLTAERFIPSPFTKGERLYRSGDLARWCQDGTLEYLGRLDHQIKLRGLRIELGEIESVMRAHPGVQDAVAIARNDQLIGYVQGKDINTDALTTDLKHHLPDYMVPAHLITLEAFPLSANGKLDRKALPDPELPVAGYEAPQGETEQWLASLWQELLDVETVGRHQHFFELGGHSLLVTKLLARIRTETGVQVPLAEVFEATTVARQAELLEQHQTSLLDDERLDDLDALMNELEGID